jgi:hypothetical protein
MTALTEHELTVMVDRAASGTWESRRQFNGGPAWSELDRATQNAIREQALPFIYHGTKALDELGYRKLRLIATEDELGALPFGSVVRETDGTVLEFVRELGYVCNGEHRYVGTWYSTGSEVPWDNPPSLPVTVLDSPEES